MSLFLIPQVIKIFLAVHLSLYHVTLYLTYAKAYLMNVLTSMQLSYMYSFSLSLFPSPLPFCIENRFFFFLYFYVFLFFIFHLFLFKNFSWRRIALPCCIRFCSATCISCKDTHILFLSLYAYLLSTVSVITGHQAELPVLYSSSPLAILCFFFLLRHGILVIFSFT